MQTTLELPCRVIGRLKLSNVDILESLTNSLIFSMSKTIKLKTGRSESPLTTTPL